MISMTGLLSSSIKLSQKRSIPRPPPAPYITRGGVCFGDSTAFGQNATADQYRWINIVCDTLAIPVVNKGISGTVMQNRADSGGSPRANNGRSRYVADLLGTNARSHVFILYGLNDLRYTGAPGSMNYANFISDYAEVVRGLLAAGISDITLMSPCWIPNGGYASGSAGFTGSNRTIHEQYVAGIYNLAFVLGVKYAPVYEYMRDNGGASLVDTDLIHPTNAGHAIMATAALAAAVPSTGTWPSTPVDSTAPALLSAVIASATPNKIVFTYSETLSSTITGSIALSSPSKTVSSATVVGSTVEVVVSTPYVFGDAPIANLPAGWVRDAANNTSTALPTQTVTNGIASGVVNPAQPVFFYDNNTAWTKVAGERYSSSVGTTTFDAVAQIAGSTPLGQEAWVEVQHPNTTDAGAVIVLDETSALPVFTANTNRRYLAQLTQAGLVLYSENSAGSSTTTGYTFPSASANNRVRLHLSAAGVVTVQTTTDNGTNWTVRHTFGTNASTYTGPFYWRLYSSLQRDIYQPRQSGVAVPVVIPETFEAMYAPDFQLDTTESAVTRPTITKPVTKAANLASPSYTDARFGTPIYMVAEPADTTTPSIGFVHQDYAKRQVFNCDDTKFAVFAENGFWHVYDAATFQRISITGGTGGAIPQCVGDCDLQWDAFNPNKMVYTDDRGGISWRELDIRTGAVTTAFSFSGRQPPGMSTGVRFSMGSEGRCSKDGRYWCFMVQTSLFACLGYITYDRLLDTILSYTPATVAHNWCGVTNSGAYAVIGSNGGGSGNMATERARDINTMNGTRAWPIADIGGSNFTILDTFGGHGDVATDAYGDDVWFSASYAQGNDNGVADGELYYRRVRDEYTFVYPQEWAMYWAGGGQSASHFNGAAYNRQGWGVMSYNSTGEPTTGRDGTICVVELQPNNPRVHRIAHTQRDGVPESTLDNYASTPFAVTNRSLTKILFTSDWRNTAKPYRTYMIGLAKRLIRVAGSSAPINTAPPTIAGSSAPGGVLTRTPGTYTGLPTPSLSGKWQQSSNSGSSWSDIGTETSSDYTVGVSLGIWVSWLEAAGNTNGNISTRSNVIVVAALAAPANTVAPTVPASGYTDTPVTATAGTWTGNPTPTIARTWQRDISGTWTDTAFTSLTATLTPVGTYRLREIGSSAGNSSVTVYSGSCVIAAPAVEPVATTSLSLVAANGTTLEALNSAWDGASTEYVIQSNRLVAAVGWNQNLTYYTAGGGNNQALKLVVASGFVSSGGQIVYGHINAHGTQAGYAFQIDGTNVRLFRNGVQQGGPVAHGVNPAAATITVEIRRLLSRVRVYIQGSSTAAFDFTDSTPLTGGFQGFANYSSGNPTTVQVQEVSIGSS